MLHGMGTGIRLTLSYNELRSVLLPVPPLQEQDQIVNFLDWKISEINRLISIREEEISGLRELKKSVVDSAILIGIDKTVKFKATGLYYIPEIPESWELVKIKRICDFGALINDKLKKFKDDDLVNYIPSYGKNFRRRKDWLLNEITN